jgi:DNA-binding response OmpR family regulator
VSGSCFLKVPKNAGSSLDLETQAFNTVITDFPSDGALAKVQAEVVEKIESMKLTQQSTVPLASQRPAILMVDDEPSCLQVLTSALGNDYQLICAVKAADALALARNRNPHLVLLDVMMPEMDGFAICSHLREDATTKDLAIIFLSSLQDPRDRTRGIELGAVDFITKPFDPAEIRARVRRHVELQDERRKLLASVVSPEERIRRIIGEGENERTEFKSTLRWSVKDNKIDHGVEIAWLKTVAAFLNSDGGRLVVGVDNQGIPLGIKLDDFENEDKYLLHVNNRLQQHIGVEHAANIRFGLYPTGDLKVLLIECSPASKPVFLIDAGQESFYVRTGPGTRKLTMSQMLAYVVERGRV